MDELKDYHGDDSQVEADDPQVDDEMEEDSNWVNGPDEDEDEEDEDYVPHASLLDYKPEPRYATEEEAYAGDEEEVEEMQVEEYKESPSVVIHVSEAEFHEMQYAPITLLNRGLASLLVVTAYIAGMVNTYNVEAIAPMGEVALREFRATLAAQLADTMVDVSQFEIDATIETALQYGGMWAINVGGEDGTVYTLMEFHALLRGNSPAYDFIGTGMDTVNALIDTVFNIGGTFHDAFAGFFGGQISLSAAGESIAYMAFAVVFALMIRTAYKLYYRTGANITVHDFFVFIREQISPITMIIDTVLARVLLRNEITDEDERFWIGSNDWPYPEDLGYDNDGNGKIDTVALHRDVTSSDNNYECLHGSSQSQSQGYGDVDGVQAMFDMASDLILNASSGTTSHNIVENLRYGCNMMSGLIARCTRATVCVSSLLKHDPDEVVDGTALDTVDGEILLEEVDQTQSGYGIDDDASQSLAQILTEMENAEAETDKAAAVVIRMLSSSEELHSLATDRTQGYAKYPPISFATASSSSSSAYNFPPRPDWKDKFNPKK